MKLHVVTLAVLPLVAALALAGCAAPAETTDSGAPLADGTLMSETPQAMETHPTGEVPEQLNFTAIDVATGDTVDGASLAGQDVILWFWASWCPVCQAEAPAVAEAAAQLPPGVTLIGVPGRSDVASSQGFVDDNGLGDFQHLYDEDGAIWSSFGVASQPAFALINDDGSVKTIPGGLGTAGILDAATELADA